MGLFRAQFIRGVPDRLGPLFRFWSPPSGQRPRSHQGGKLPFYCLRKGPGMWHGASPMPVEVPSKDLVLVGGGHAHCQVLKRWAMELPVGIRPTLISDSSQAVYSGMLPGAVSGAYGADEIQVELGPLARASGARFLRARVLKVDPEGRQVFFEDRPPVSFDLLSLNIGSVSRGGQVPGVKEYAVSTRPIGSFLERVEALERAFAEKEKPVAQLVVVGGGAAGVELSCGLTHRLRQRGVDLKCTLVESGSALLADASQGAQKKVGEKLKEIGVEVQLGLRVQRVESEALFLEDGRRVPFDLLIWAAGAAPPKLIGASGMPTDEEGYLKVRPTLQVLGFDHIFGVGDCVRVEGYSWMPRAGLYAVRSGPILVQNLEAAVQGKTLVPFRPQRNFLKLLGTGDGEAIADYKGFGFRGPWVWKWKDWIDRRWMRKFDPARLGMGMTLSDSKTMATSSNGGISPMPCAGCGAKVSASMLDRALGSLQIHPNERVQVGLGAVDDAAVVSIPPGKVTVQTVDYFRSFIDDPFLLGRVAAVHAASDIFAMGADADTALAIVTLPYESNGRRQQEDLEQLMAGVVRETNAMKASLVGGHTGEGPEMSVGLVLTGLADADSLFTKGGLEPGDRLVLTKPLGTGVLLAAEMRNQARGVWIDEALACMLGSNELAVEILRAAGVKAVTDVTGFGLAVHLAEMLEASDASAKLNLEAVPTLSGALSCLSQEIESTLAPSNQRHLIKGWAVQGGNHSHAPILYDPQTSGGFLFGVKPDRLSFALDGLHQAGYTQATEIGEVISGHRQLLLS